MEIRFLKSGYQAKSGKKSMLVSQQILKVNYTHEHIHTYKHTHTYTHIHTLTSEASESEPEPASGSSAASAAGGKVFSISVSSGMVVVVVVVVRPARRDDGNIIYIQPVLYFTNRVLAKKEIQVE